MVQECSPCLPFATEISLHVLLFPLRQYACRCNTSRGNVQLTKSPRPALPRISGRTGDSGPRFRQLAYSDSRCLSGFGLWPWHTTTNTRQATCSTVCRQLGHKKGFWVITSKFSILRCAPAIFCARATSVASIGPTGGGLNATILSRRCPAAFGSVVTEQQADRMLLDGAQFGFRHVRPLQIESQHGNPSLLRPRIRPTANIVRGSFFAVRARRPDVRKIALAARRRVRVEIGVLPGISMRRWGSQFLWALDTGGNAAVTWWEERA